MNILSLPVELQEKILVNIPHETKIELVCHLWNKICKKEVIVNRRFSCICLELRLTAGPFDKCKSSRHKCICNLSVHYARVCRATNHPCICKNGPHHAKYCKGTNHPCICKDDPDSVHHALMCRGENHPCICNRYLNFTRNCKHKGRCGFI
jgi:hypothetical protein